MKNLTAKDAKAALALKALNLIKTEFLLELPFLSGALDALSFAPDLSTRTIGCDAIFIKFNPTYVIDTFLHHTDILRRTYMQMLIHCIFGHVFRQDLYEDKDLFSLCSDICAESIVDEIDARCVYRLSSDYRDRTYKMLSDNIDILTADRLYEFFVSNPPNYEEEKRLCKEFVLDDHSFWKLPKANDKKHSAKKETGNNWENTAKHVLEDLKHGHSTADNKGSLIRMLRAKFNSKTDYKDLLKKYSIIREDMKIDPDTFDYGLYYYGFSLYENMPLIEENEYSERKAIDDLVIAIDTSASCQDEHVQRFLNETASILEDSESFFRHTNIVIIECDNTIQEVITLDNPEKIKDYAKHFTVKGGYGTDFRPVFYHVESMIKAGKIKNLKGLLYFTDGFGEYPSTPTLYETSFVLWKEGAHAMGKIPYWAQVLYFNEH